MTITRKNVALFVLPFVLQLVFAFTNNLLSEEPVCNIVISSVSGEYGGTENDMGIEEPFSMTVTASINDPVINAEIKDGTLEWRIKSVKFEYFDEETGVYVFEQEYFDSDILENSNHPFFIERKIGVWGDEAYWEVQKVEDNGSWFTQDGLWRYEFNVEFRATHKVTDDLIQTGSSQKQSISAKPYAGMFVDQYAIEGTADILSAQFIWITNLIDPREYTVIPQPIPPFYTRFKIDWADTNISGITEEDFVENITYGNTVFPSSAGVGFSSVGRISENSYDIKHNLSAGKVGQFLLHAISETTNEEPIEVSTISILERDIQYQRKYNVLGGNERIQEGKIKGSPVGTEGRYLVGECAIVILKDVTLFASDNGLPLLADNNSSGIHENDIRQGGIGDCYFLACLMILAKYEKDIISSNLNIELNTNNKPTSFSAMMYSQSGQPNSVLLPITNFLTHGDSQAKLSGDYDYNSLEVWPQVYEKAWSVVRSDSSRFGNIHSGKASDAWTALTGKICPNPIGAVNKTNAQIHSDIMTSLNNGGYVCIGTKKTIQKPLATQSQNGVPAEDHAYVVVECNATHVKLENPHGADKGVTLLIDDLNKVVDYIFPLPKP
jgi:hypothetical protein